MVYAAATLLSKRIMSTTQGLLQQAWPTMAWHDKPTRREGHEQNPKIRRTKGENAPEIMTWPPRIRALGRDFAVLFLRSGSGVSGALFVAWVGTSLLFLVLLVVNCAEGALAHGLELSSSDGVFRPGVRGRPDTPETKRKRTITRPE